MPKDIAPASDLAVSVGQHSEAGRKPANQDFHGALIPSGLPLRLKGATLALADGISSSPVSREAAETAVKSLLTDYYCTPEAWTVRTAASKVIAAANAWLHGLNRAARLTDMDRGQVCTLAALILKGRFAHVLHVGDSRVWRLAGDGLEPLTEDHRITVSSAESWLGRALGAAPQVEIDYRRLPLAPGDVFLLTTDGVHEHWDLRQVAHVLRHTADLDVAARTIAVEALARGSDDNLTLQIARIESLPPAGPEVLAEEAGRLPPPPVPEPGDLLDGHRILRPLHRSARSHVFLAVTPDGERVALKVPAVEMRQDRAHLRRFLMEEWIARRIKSPHVLPAAPAPETRRALWIATKYVAGQSLRQWMHDHPRPQMEEVRRLAEQIVAGLRAFHRRDMLHQDLRPENILIDRDGTVKRADFGSVRVSGLEEAGAGEQPVLGTRQYSAPEYFTGEPADWRADQFSLGVIVYEMLTGRLPYGNDVSRIATVRQRRRLRYRPAASGDRAVPEWLDLALRRAVHPDPARRFDALSEFVAALRVPPPGHGRSAPRPLAERDPVRFWQAVSAALALTLVILLALSP